MDLVKLPLLIGKDASNSPLLLTLIYKVTT